MQNTKKIMFIHTEGWFFLSHFKPLARAADKAGFPCASIVTNAGASTTEMEQLGLKVIDLDFDRASFNPFSALAIAMRLRTIIKRQNPDIVHFVALKPMLTGGLACVFLPRISRIYHVTGMGHLAEGKSLLARLRRLALFSLLSVFINHPRAWLCAENPDDLKFLARFGARTDRRTSLLGGAGVNPDHFKPGPAGPTDDEKLRAGYVGRMIWSKGVDVLVEASTLLRETDAETKIDIELYGAPDLSNPKALQIGEIERWNQMDAITWHGPVQDVRQVWQRCQICVVPTRTREGMPRAMLEAAACARPLIVTDIPGCRHFVRDGIEGFVIPPNDPAALAEALATLAKDPALRMEMGKAARKRVLEGFSEKHVVDNMAAIYRNLTSQNKDQLQVTDS